MSDNAISPKWEIIQGDALSLLRSYPAGSFDAIITDPPYASGGRTQAEKNKSTAQKYSSCLISIFGSSSLVHNYIQQ